MQGVLQKKNYKWKGLENLVRPVRKSERVSHDDRF